MSYFRKTCFVLVLYITTATLAGADDRVAVSEFGQSVATPEWIYVITHGMGGTVEGDRFERLAKSIKSANPNANIYLINWNKDAQGRWPWAVARAISDVASAGSKRLHELRVDPQRLTLIGESFGNNVNVGIAARLGQVARMLALNPANELGGGGRIDLTAYCDQAWTFHSHSAYDTHQRIGHRSVLLRTPEGSTPSAQHTYGAKWLRKTIQQGDSDWLLMSEEIPTAPLGLFDVAILTDGELDWELAPRRGCTQEVDNATRHETLIAGADK